MARPKSQPEGAPTERVNAPVTEPAVSAPVYTPPPPPRMPRQLQVERQGGQNAAYSVRYPQVRGGICEFCGVLDPNVDSRYQYKLCPHFRGMQLMCSYCPDSKNPDDVIYTANLNIAQHPDNPNKLVVWCNSYECSKAHTERFKISS